jgi:hypothetical protein
MCPRWRRRQLDDGDVAHVDVMVDALSHCGHDACGINTLKSARPRRSMPRVIEAAANAHQPMTDEG